MTGQGFATTSDATHEAELGRPEEPDERLAAWSQRLRRFPHATAAALMAITVVVYAGALGNGFAYDDQSQILLNPFVASPHLWPRIFSGAVWSFQGTGAQANFYRPLQVFCYWILYRLAGAAPAVFHLFSVAIYALTVLLVYRLGIRLFEERGAGRSIRLGQTGRPCGEAPALAGALLWALHPLHVEAAAWISALPDLGCGLFFLLAFLLFLRAERMPGNKLRGHVLGAAAYLPALFFKEAALGLPLVLAAYWTFSPGRLHEGLGRAENKSGPGESSRNRVRAALIFALYLVPVAVYLAARHRALGHFSDAGYFWRVSPQVAEAALGLLGQHLKLFLWPAHLSPFRTFEAGPSLRTPWPWLAVAMLVTAILYRRRSPFCGFLIWWWFLTLAPCLDVRQLSVPFLADRFSYLPTVGLCLAVSRLTFEFLRRAFRTRRLGFAIAGFAAILFLAAGGTIRAVGHWRDEETLLNYSLRESPLAPKLHRARGLVLEYRYGDYDGAEREYALAMRLNHSGLQPNSELDYECTLGLGRIAQHLGNFQAAIREDEAAVRLLPGLSPAYDALGVIYFPRGDYARATPYFERAVRANPQDLGALFYLGTCYFKLGRFKEAAGHFHSTTLIDPDYWPGYDAEARALEAVGDFGGAAAVRRLESRK